MCIFNRRNKMLKSFVLGLVLVLVLGGCAKNNKIDVGEIIRDNKPIVMTVVQVGSTKGVEAAFKKWAEKDPIAAKEAATALSKDFTLNVLPYLDGKADFKTQDEIDTFLNSSVVDKFPDEVKELISNSFLVLDLYIKVPDANTLKPEYLDYLRSFIVGVRNGCDKFLE